MHAFCIRINPHKKWQLWQSRFSKSIKSFTRDCITLSKHQMTPWPMKWLVQSKTFPTRLNEYSQHIIITVLIKCCVFRVRGLFKRKKILTLNFSYISNYLFTSELCQDKSRSFFKHSIFFQGHEEFSLSTYIFDVYISSCYLDVLDV